MNSIEELEKTLLDQIEKLSDDSIAPDSKEARVMIEKSKCMSDLAGNFVEIQKARNENARIRIEAVRTAHNVSVGDKSDITMRRYLGIEG